MITLRGFHCTFVQSTVYKQQIRIAHFTDYNLFFFNNKTTDLSYQKRGSSRIEKSEFDWRSLVVDVHALVEDLETAIISAKD